MYKEALDYWIEIIKKDPITKDGSKQPGVNSKENLKAEEEIVEIHADDHDHRVNKIK